MSRNVAENKGEGGGGVVIHSGLYLTPYLSRVAKKGSFAATHFLWGKRDSGTISVKGAHARQPPSEGKSKRESEASTCDADHVIISWPQNKSNSWKKSEVSCAKSYYTEKDTLYTSYV